MSKYLVIFESPKKAEKARGFLGSDYETLGSKGHVIDLPSDEIAVDIKNGFKPTYVTMADKKSIVDDIIKKSKKAQVVYLATDPDREGEKISSLIASVLPSGTIIKRARYHEVTKQAILDAIKNAGSIDNNLADAAEARRILDRIVGYKSSWPVQQATGGKSAGRCQSAALRILADREKEIKAFIPVVYWPIEAELITSKQERIQATIKVPKPLDISTKEEAEKIIAVLKKGPVKVSKYEEKQANVNPYAPFSTPVLLQTASTCLGMSLDRTKRASQDLFEKGLITYHRTDSTHIIPDFVNDIRTHIKTACGPNYVPAKPVSYAAKIKNAQEAHEACRVCDLKVPAYTDGTDDEKNLYEMIWRRTIASQMVPAQYLRKSSEFACEKYVLSATGSKEVFDGFKKVWTYSTSSDNYLPALVVGEKVDVDKITTERKETQPPSRYNEASLVSKLKDEGIGRPATYDTIVKTLLDRKYTETKGKAFVVTDLGMRVTDFLVKADFCFVDIKFTGLMEDKLDEVASATKTKLEVLTEFWERLQKDLKNAKSTKEQLNVTNYDCPICTKGGREGKLVKKYSKWGAFYSCVNYSDKVLPCKYIAQVGPNGEPVEKAKKTAAVLSSYDCPICGKKMVERSSQYGKFYGCQKFPVCRGMRDSNGVEKKPSTGKPKFKKWGKKKKSEDGETNNE